MQKLKTLVNELKTKNFKITNSTKGEQLHQTQRNKLKHDLLIALFESLKEHFDYVYFGKDGVMLEIDNDSIKDNIKNELGSGSITATLDIKINSLEFNAQEESDNYELEQKEKADKKAKANEKKAEKIARDKKERESR